MDINYRSEILARLYLKYDYLDLKKKTFSEIKIQ
jgi:hypothetical protein